MRPVIIGAGPTGLAAAWALCEAGTPPLILEKQEDVGGLSGSFDWAGFQADYGPHRLHQAAGPEIVALYQAALGEGLGERKRSGVVHLGGRRLPYPLSIPGLLGGLGLGGSVRHLVSALAARILPPRGEDFGGEAARRLGRLAARRLYEPAARKVWGLEPDQLDVSLGRARVQKTGPWAVLQAATGKKGSGRRYFYPDQGAGGLSRGLARRIREAGGEIRCGVTVEGLRIEGGRVVGVIVEGRAIEASSVIATAPLPALCQWVGRGDAAEGLEYRSLVLLYLLLDVDRVSGHDVHYFSDPDLPANRLFEMKGFSNGEGPVGRTVVGFDLPCTLGDSIWTSAPSALVEKVHKALQQVGVGDAGVLDVTAVRFPQAYPIYRKGYTVPRDRALDALSTVEGLYPVGRHALFVHDNVHHACAAGLAAGRAVAGAVSAQSWRQAQAPFLYAQIED